MSTERRRSPSSTSNGSSTSTTTIVARGATAVNSSGGNSSSGSGLRSNPFDSHLSALPEAMSNAVFSPSVFSVVLSPSQECTSLRSQTSSSSASSQFWSLEQQASLFPAEISAESPWKQQLASLDPETENRTQEAIEAFFSNQNNVILSPCDGSKPMETSSLCLRTQQQPQKVGLDQDNGSFVHFMETSQSEGGCDKSSQTCLSLPPVLPQEMASLYEMLCSMSSMSMEETSRLDESRLQTNNTSLRRRKLFDQEALVMDGDDEENKENSLAVTSQSPLSKGRLRDQRQKLQQEHLMSSPIMSGLVRSSSVHAASNVDAMKTPDAKFKSPLSDPLSYLTPIAKMAPSNNHHSGQSTCTPSRMGGGCGLSPIVDLRSQRRNHELCTPLGNSNRNNSEFRAQLH